MILDFFQLATIPSNHFNGSYDTKLVVLSFMVAMSASYIALDLTGRLRDINITRTSSLLWLIGGAIAMGAGIWSMHFIGMLSFTIPGLTLRYDLFWTVLSLFVAILASGFALYLLQTSKIRIEHYIAGGIILGLAIASMHYTGMEAMFITLNIRYLPNLFFLSILIAILASEAALWLALKSNQVILKVRNRIKIVSAMIMGLAICGMHYTGMAASIFTPLCAPSLVAGTSALDPTLLSIGIATVTFIILGVAYFASSFKESLNQQQFERARQLGMAEISASVLHNVGNVLNSVNVSASILTEKNKSSKLIGLKKLSGLFNEHKQDLSVFLTKDSHGVKAIEFLNMLTEYWQKEQNSMSEELATLNKNINLIKEIISTQQDLSKLVGFEQIISINELLDEVLLITGLSLKKDIIIEKHYCKVNRTMTDKTKLLQILINLIRNAKDAIMESSKKNKIIIIKTSIIKDKIIIEISDNGVGILPKNISKIFNYGFSTKLSGHGFGLHTCAIDINTMGGEISVKSEGLEQGASFIIKLPYRKAL
jgi:NO-binding membrane sensor protein with MHYT domain